jgi:hypothetical protein
MFQPLLDFTKSMPIVGMKESMNWFSVYWLNKVDFPTLESPRSRILNKDRLNEEYEFDIYLDGFMIEDF